MAKHVIILGAGASATSGYPLANKLRLQIGSEMHFRSAVNASYQAYVAETTGMDREKQAPHLEAALKLFHHYGKSIRAFRHGAYATVDEFCKLISSQNRADLLPLVDGMRHMIRLVLGLSNPEHSFHDSDYYPFIQKLFKPDLASLRNDIVVMTFNYDPYLDYLLLRSLRERTSIKGSLGPDGLDADLVDSVTSGFHNKKTDWLGKLGFKLLKLHGTICERASGTDYETFFSTTPALRITALSERSKAGVPPPIVFPWEIFLGNGQFRSDNEDFVLKHDAAYLPLFKGIWECARREIYEAEKISFVGLSMHPFLNQAMHYLFGGGRGHQVKRKVVVADKSHEEVAEKGKSGIYYHPEYSPAKKLEAILNEVDESNKSHFGYVSPIYRFSALNSFREFIEKEMDPNRE